jgi:hypothetical protein
METLKGLPLGMADFKRIVSDGRIYVDKTAYISKLLQAGHNFFMSRPRRFGKSLTVSTLYYLFKGEKELFKNTYISDKWDFKPYPVIKLSMTAFSTSDTDSIKAGLIYNLKVIYKESGLSPVTERYELLFEELIDQLYEKMGPVAVLIDEYDRPTLQHINNPAKAREIRDVMRDFYIILKDREAKLRFVFLTGITKITKMGVFSTLNHLTELTTNESYSQMLGITSDELVENFGDYLDAAGEKLKMNRKELLENIAYHYNGFSFDGIHGVYNPFSLVNFFFENRFKNFWASSGLPSHLADYVKLHKLKPEDYLNTYITDEDLTAFEIENAPAKSLLAQSGYLTFKGFDPVAGYLLDYPNTEVKDSFSALILSSSYNFDYAVQSDMRASLVYALRNRDFESVFKAMQRTLANVPGNLYDTDSNYPQKEAYYNMVILTLLWTCNLNVQAQEWSAHGISDLVLKFNGDVYVIELKKASKETAIQQIKDKGYAEKYNDAPYLVLVGIEVDAENHRLKDWGQEVVKPLPGSSVCSPCCG